MRHKDEWLAVGFVCVAPISMLAIPPLDAITGQLGLVDGADGVRSVGQPAETNNLLVLSIMPRDTIVQDEVVQEAKESSYQTDV